jgi:cob(I)alamin adenosyltransferase
MDEILEKRDLDTVPPHKGLVQIYTGDGKGKTSAALGAVLRAAGHGLKVSVIFFMKGEYSYGERKALAGLPGVVLKSFGEERFVFPDRLKEDQKVQAGLALAAARKDIMSGDFDLVVLDEINVAAAFKLLDVRDVLRLIKDKPEKVELILTGRKADDRLVQAADLVTEMVKIKHPYDNGQPARPGFDF